MQRTPILSPLVSPLFVALSLHAGHAMALGFGRVSGNTALGQPLAFSVGLRLDSSETLEPRCVGADVTAGDRVLPAEVVRARLVRVGSSGERRVRVSTTVPIEEPTVTVTVRVGCADRLTRQFVVFADPQHLMARIGDPDTDGADDTDLQTAPALAASPPPAPARRREAAPTAAPDARASAPVAPRRARAAASAPTPTPTPTRGRPVLQLDPIEAEDLAQPTLRMAVVLGTTPALPGAASAPMDPEDARRRQDLERLQSLEAAVRQLRDDSAAKDRALADLQAQARTAAAARYANPLVYTLAGLCALLGLGLVAALWLRQRDRSRALWWGAEAAGVTESVTPPPADLVAAPAPHPVTAPVPPGPAVRPTVAAAVATPAPVEEPLSVSDIYTARGETADEPRRPMSAEELIDLEQQVEFFVVLGQDDAAIDLLMGHVRSTSGVSPLPYIKLLEIYRRRGEREPFDRIRERFNRRFNAYAPEWGVDPEAGLDLEGYPEVLERLQGIWQMPSMAMELLDTHLFRRDAGPTFDVPAYRELLFLYGIARDLAERDIPASGVDLLLPLGDEDPSVDGPIVPLAPDMSAEPVPEEARFQLDLDVSTDQPPHLTVELPPDSERGRPLDFQLDDTPPRRDR